MMTNKVLQRLHSKPFESMVVYRPTSLVEENQSIFPLWSADNCYAVSIYADMGIKCTACTRCEDSKEFRVIFTIDH